MPKQKCGYPFTDSWFEFPFWVLFLIILIVIGLAVGGIFNSKSIPSQPKPIISGQTWHQPEFDITNAYMENGEAVITYVSNKPYEGLKVKLRLVDGDKKDEWKDFSIGTKTIRLQPKNLNSVGISVEGYIDYENTPVTPITSIPVTKDAKSTSNQSGNLMLFATSNNKNPYKSPLPPPQPTKPEPTPNSTSSSGSGSIVPPPSSKPTILPGVPTPSTQKSILPGSLHENFWPF
jgi:PAB1-binding protein PBP1